jgi:imidazolonepropionase
MILYKNIKELLTLSRAHKKDGRNLTPDDLCIIKNASIVVDDHNKILWVGDSNKLPSEHEHLKSIDCSSIVVTPEIVDSHTHLVFGGDRSFEYTMRLNGADYEDIAKAGGGILSTMAKTLAAKEDELFKTACERIERIHSYGVGTIEIKSGYALTIEGERLITNLIHKLKQKYVDKVTIFNTFLAAHAVPKDYKNSSDYLIKVVLPLLDEFKGKDMIDAVDIFHEEGYFNTEDVHKLFQFCNENNFKVKIHADEFNDNKGAVLASKYNALSADHLLATKEDGIKALANSNTVATLLPGTAFFLGKPLANARQFLDQGCKVALASDFNPGSCHCDNLLLIAQLSAKSLNMNSAEAWSAITLNASHALGLKNQGAIVSGLDAKFSFFDTDSIDNIFYSWGRNFSIS